jgi:hypothetical protein
VVCVEGRRWVAAVAVSEPMRAWPDGFLRQKGMEMSERRQPELPASVVENGGQVTTSTFAAIGCTDDPSIHRYAKAAAPDVHDGKRPEGSELGDMRNDARLS